MRLRTPIAPRLWLADLVNTTDLKLVAAAFGTNPEGIMIYVADRVEEGRLPGAEPAG